MYDYIVFSGGGLKGLTYIGVLKYLEEYSSGIILDNIKGYVGCSIGAFTALTFLAGYKSDDLKDIINKINFESFVDYKISTLFDKYGLDSGKKIENFIKVFLVIKGFKEDITFKELYEKIPKKLVIITTNLNMNSTEYFSFDTYPDTPVYLAIKMSMTVPVFFQPVKYKNCYYVDGALTCNFPVSYFDNYKDVKIIAFSFNKNKKDHVIKSFYSYLCNVIYSVFFTVENLYIKQAINNNIDVVIIDNNSLSGWILKLNITDDIKNNLYDIGYSSIKNFMNKKNKFEKKQ